MNQLREVEVFLQVAELGSFTAAAQALRIPKSSATTLVQALEARLQVRLLHRTTRRVSLTPEGALYYEEAGRLLRGMADLEASLGRAAASPRGRLRVDVPASAGRHLLAPALPSFLARYPDIVIELGSTDRPIDVLGEGVDCVLRGGDLHDETLVARKLAELPVLTCAAPSYLAQRGTPSSPAELAGHVFVNYFSSKTGRVFPVDFARQEESYELRPAHRVAANDADTWVALALAGLGILQAPCSVGLRDAVERGALVPLLLDWESEGLPVFVMYPKTRTLAARVRVFVDWVTELYQAEERAARRFLGARR